ncbi:MAG: hypothetical protein ACXVTC_13990 [Solirubrobacteraceae bacterium]
MAPEAPLEPCGLVRVVTGELADAEPELGDGCDGLVRVVTGALADPEAAGADRCDGLVRVVTAPPAETTALDEPAWCEPLAPVWIERAALTAAPLRADKDPGRTPVRDGACRCRTMWIVRRITWVVTAAGGVRAASDVDDRGADRNEKPARPAASRAAKAPAIRV